jgi:hypothetical protein
MISIPRGPVDRTFLVIKALLASIFRVDGELPWEIDLREKFRSVIVTYLHLVRFIDPPRMGKRR